MIENLILSAIFVTALWFSFNKFFPSTSRRVKSFLLTALGRKSPAPVLVKTPTGCGSGCGKCNGCG
ncbi:MAG: hypothetical protein QM523_04505 [Candidatus Pacebacteria bacterium]|nr:hypothetical protein [Candidatus Paceibacterota bacterium]